MGADDTFSKDFHIDTRIFTTTQLTLAASTDGDAAEAVLTNSKFPDRDIQVGHISVAADTGHVSIKPAELPAGTSVSFDVSSSAQGGLGVYGRFADAVAALHLADRPCLELADEPGKRYLLMDFGYSASLSGSASHPVGVLGSASFGVDAKRDSAFALLHRFDATEGAHLVLDDSLASWRLPRHVAYDGHDLNIKPETWLLVEVDGYLSLKLSARLGWNMSFAKDLKLLGVAHDLSARIDASLTASFGFDVSGKYILVVGREGAGPSVRLRLSKQSSKGLNFGLNLSVGAEGSDPQLPSNLDNFVKAAFGVHGLQVIKDLRQWTDPSADLGQKIAGLTNQTALDLLKTIDPASDFDKAKEEVADALNQWAALPGKLSTMLWGFLGQQVGPDEVADFKTFLMDLADPKKGAGALAATLQKATFGATPQGQFLESVADQGLLALANDMGPVSTAASQAFKILNGGVIEKLQSFINQRLDLDQICKAANDGDFKAVDQWLQNRLGNFLDKELGLDDLKDIQKAIQTLDTKAKDFYQTAIQATARKYSVDFSATYQRSTTDTALIDVTFDLSNQAAANLFAEVVRQCRLDDLLTKETAGVTLNLATLSHSIDRKATVDLNMPLFDFSSTHVNDAMASLKVEDQGGRLLLYQVDAKDNVTIANRAASQLSVLASMKITQGQPPVLDSGGSISYEMRQVKAGMRPIDLEAYTAGFIHEYLEGLFGGGEASVRSFYTDLDYALTAATHSQSNFLGDVAVSMQLSLPAAVLTGWFRPGERSLLAADQTRLSRALQGAWRSLLPDLYFQDPGRYEFTEPVAALLVWSSMPVSTNIDVKDGNLQFNRDKEVYWDWPNVNLRSAVAGDRHTVVALAKRLTTIHGHLVEAGNSSADSFEPSNAASFVQLALDAMGDNLMHSLLDTEAEMVEGASAALKNASAALSTEAIAPTQAIKALANFAAKLTDTFNQKVRSVYGGKADRAVGPMLLVHASEALGSAGVQPSAVLTLYALSPGHIFDLSSFITGTNPSKADVALSQTLVSLK